MTVLKIIFKPAARDLETFFVGIDTKMAQPSVFSFKNKRSLYDTLEWLLPTYTVLRYNNI